MSRPDPWQTRRRVLGDEYVDSQSLSPLPEIVEFQEFVTRFAWDECWGDDRLSLRERSLVTLAVTAALGRRSEFALHLVGAVNNGISPDELVALIKHVAVYGGVPAGVAAFGVFREQLLEQADGREERNSALTNQGKDKEEST